MAIMDWFKPSQKRFEQSGELDIANFRRYKKEILDKLYSINSISHSVEKPIKKDFEGVSGAFKKLLDDIEETYQNNFNLKLSVENLQEEEYKSKQQKSIEEGIEKQKINLMNELEMSSLNLISITAKVLAYNKQLPPSEVFALRDSIIASLSNIIKASADCFSARPSDPKNIMLENKIYRECLTRFNQELKKYKEAVEKREQPQLKPAYVR